MKGSNASAIPIYILEILWPPLMKYVLSTANTAAIPHFFGPGADYWKFCP